MRVLRSIGAAAALLAVVVGVPVLLWLLAPPRTVLGRDWSRVLTAPDDGSVLVLVLAVLGWLAWLALTASIVAEAVELLSRGRWQVRLPGTTWLRPMAAVLVGAALGGLIGVGAGHRPTGDPPSTHQPPQQVATTEAAPRLDDAPVPTHRVSEHDDLWSIADEYYGDGAAWRRITEANPAVDPDKALVPGTLLRLPGAHPVVPADVPADPHLVEPASTSVVVKKGDTLSGLAETHLGDADRWPEIHRANRQIIADPDVIDIGWRLTIPGAGAVPSPVNPARSQHPHDESADTQKSRPVEASPDTDTDTADPGRATASPAPTPASAPPQSSAPATPTSNASHGAVPASPQATHADVPTGGASRDSADHRLVALASLGLTATLSTVLVGAWRRHRGTQLSQRALGRRVLPLSESTARFLTGIGSVSASADEGAPTGPVDPSTVAPATVVLGTDDDGDDILLDLAAAQVTTVSGPADLVRDLVGGMATTLACADWAAGVSITVVGRGLAWTRAFEHPGLTHADHLDDVLATWRESARRRHEAGASLSSDVLPEVMLIGETMSADDLAVLQRALAPGMAVVVPVDDASCAIAPPAEHLSLTSAERAHCRETGQHFTPQLIGEPARRALIELATVAASPTTLPAPWWSSGPPDDIPVIHSRPVIDTQPEPREDDPMLTARLIATGHPVLLVLGTVEVVGARGVPPTRAAKQCAEYCAWIHRHPGRTSAAMGQSLLVAEGTRRSNMSRLRSWLGTSDEGDQYLPEAYTGRIALDALVTSDWEHVQVLVAAGVNLTHSQGLVDALALVRGEPFADAAPGQWHWAEGWRDDIVSTVRDIALVLFTRAMAADDVETARWALHRGLLAAPVDELLLASQVRLEALTGNTNEVERLVLVLTRRARTTGVDLLPDTIRTLQVAVEGRTRSREA